MPSVCYRFNQEEIFPVWIGLTKTTDNCNSSVWDLSNETLSCRRRDWTWADGTPYNYHNWLSVTGYREDPSPGELYAVIYTYGKWRSRTGRQLLDYICEKGNNFVTLIDQLIKEKNK